MAIRASMLRHRVTLENPEPPVPDGAGGYTQVWTPLSPDRVWVSITPATARDLERLTAGTVVSTATHIIRGRYHPQVTTKTRVTFKSRVFNVTGVSNPEERNLEMVLTAAEGVQ